MTGGTPSSISGTIRSAIPGANLYLLNPNGILFGPGAAVDVTGSFAASTANYLRLADGARFVAALDADDSLLSSASVAAFGFLSRQPADISIASGTVAVPEGRGVSLYAGNLIIDNATVRAPGGQIHLGTMQQPGEVPTAGGLPETAGGTIALRNRSGVDASGNAGGRVVIRGGRLTVENSRIESNTLGSGQGQGVDIAMSDSVEVVRGGQINSLSPDALGPGGNIEIAARVLRLDGGGLADEFNQPLTQISASSGNLFSEGAARGGDVMIRAGRVEIVNSARISSTALEPVTPDASKSRQTRCAWTRRRKRSPRSAQTIWAFKGAKAAT